MQEKNERGKTKEKRRKRKDCSNFKLKITNTAKKFSVLNFQFLIPNL